MLPPVEILRQDERRVIRQSMHGFRFTVVAIDANSETVKQRARFVAELCN